MIAACWQILPQLCANSPAHKAKVLRVVDIVSMDTGTPLAVAGTLIRLTIFASCPIPSRCTHPFAQAVNKIDECFSLLGLTHQQLGWALDLGAAPGAWSMYLSGHAKGVIAVDPAELHVDALAPGVVHHVQDKAEDASEAIQALLQGQQVCVASWQSDICIGSRQRLA